MIGYAPSLADLFALSQDNADEGLRAEMNANFMQLAKAFAATPVVRVR